MPGFPTTPPLSTKSQIQQWSWSQHQREPAEHAVQVQQNIVRHTRLKQQLSRAIKSNGQCEGSTRSQLTDAARATRRRIQQGVTVRNALEAELTPQQTNRVTGERLRYSPCFCRSNAPTTGATVKSTLSLWTKTFFQAWARMWWKLLAVNVAKTTTCNSTWCAGVFTRRHLMFPADVTCYRKCSIFHLFCSECCSIVLPKHVLLRKRIVNVIYKLTPWWHQLVKFILGLVG